MYNVWFCDLEKVVKAFREKLPYCETFNRIEANADGDFIIECEAGHFIVKHTDFSVWEFNGSWKNSNSKWVKAE